MNSEKKENLVLFLVMLLGIISFMFGKGLIQDIGSLLLVGVVIKVLSKPNLREMIFVKREDLSNKWWHRLKNVFIYGSTIFIAFICCSSLFSNSWVSNKYLTYSFEPNYASVKGKEVQCNFSADYIVSAFCGSNYVSDYQDILSRYYKAVNNFENYKQFVEDKPVSFTVYSDLLKTLIKQGIFDNVTAKVKSYFNYAGFFKMLINQFLLLIGWFVFWESIVYRALMYIAYGTKK